jgi:hypothetical protein
MQDYITEESLKNIGVDLEGKDVTSLLSHLNETVEERIGAELTDSLNDEKLAELVKLQDTASDEEVGSWLRDNVEDFEQIIADEIDIVLGELAESTDGINEAANQ